MSTPGSEGGPPDPGPGRPEEVKVVWHQPASPASSTPPKRTLVIALAAALVLVALVTTIIVVQVRGKAAADVPSGDPTTAPASDASNSLPPTDSPSTSSTPTDPAGPPDFSAAVATASGSVVRVLASTCQGTGVGTGFWIDSQTVVTSYQSVAKTVSTVVVDEAGDPSVAEVSGVDPASGVALLTVGSGTAGSPLTVESTSLAVGDWVAPVGLRSRSTEVSSNVDQIDDTGIGFTHRKVQFSDLAEIPGRVDVGLGGAPVVNADGQIVGAVFALPQRDQRLIVPGDRLQAGIDAARSSGEPEPGDCPTDPTGPSSQTAVSGVGPAALQAGLKKYFGGINAGDHAKAYAALGPKFHQPPFSSKSFDWATSFDFNIQVRSVSNTSGWRAWVTFDSIQASDKGPDGRTCARWSLNYRFARDDGRLEINGSNAHGGGKQAWVEC